MAWAAGTVLLLSGAACSVPDVVFVDDAAAEPDVVADATQRPQEGGDENAVTDAGAMGDGDGSSDDVSDGGPAYCTGMQGAPLTRSAARTASFVTAVPAT